MYLDLQTIDIWKVSGEFSPEVLFQGLRQLICPKDVLVLGTYDAIDEIYHWLSGHDATHKTGQNPYNDFCFEANRSQYPKGRAFSLPFDQFLVEQLVKFSGVTAGGGEKDIFFDHLVCYRPGNPHLPLLDFHDAFTGGTLLLSGLYTGDEIAGFVSALSGKATREVSGALQALLKQS